MGWKKANMIYGENRIVTELNVHMGLALCGSMDGWPMRAITERETINRPMR